MEPEVKKPGESKRVVTAFGPNHPASAAARDFYRKLGFSAAEAAPNGPEGGARQVYRLPLVED